MNEKKNETRMTSLREKYEEQVQDLERIQGLQNEIEATLANSNIDDCYDRNILIQYVLLQRRMIKTLICIQDSVNQIVLIQKAFQKQCIV